MFQPEPGCSQPEPAGEGPLEDAQWTTDLITWRLREQEASYQPCDCLSALILPQG